MVDSFFFAFNYHYCSLGGGGEYLKRKLLRLVCILNIWRILPAWLCVHLLKPEIRKNILFEVDYWGKCTNIDATSLLELFGRLMMEKKEYRNLFCHRIRYGGKAGYVMSCFFKLLFPLEKTLVIATRDIGFPLFIQHGIATIIAAKRIGSFCWINQQVTIGYSFDDEPPTLGNGVRITAGAKVIGNIYIANNAIVGANAVVVKNVLENEVVAGIPARKISDNIDLQDA